MRRKYGQIDYQTWKLGEYFLQHIDFLFALNSSTILMINHHVILSGADKKHGFE